MRPALLALFGAAAALAHPAGPVFQPTLPLDQVSSAVVACNTGAALVHQGASGFGNATTRFAVNAGYNATARVAALPDTPQQVASLLRCARTKHIPFSVLSGGHKDDLPSATAPPGLIINTAKFTSLTSHDDGTLTIGAGLRWSDVYDYAQKTTNGTRFPVGGRASHVGVSGCLLMGCDSWLTSAHGFGTENIVSMEVVLANGTVLTASPSKNTRLFNALRGSAGQLGVVTSFTVLTHPVSATQYSGTYAYSANLTTSLAKAAQTAMTKDPSGKSNFIVTFFGQGTSVQQWYNGTAAEANATGVFSAFDSLPHMPTVVPPPGEMTFDAVNREDDPLFGPGGGRGMMTTLSINSLNETFFANVQTRLTEFSQNHSNLTGTNIHIEPLKKSAFGAPPVPGAVWPPDEGVMAAVLGISTSWADASQDQAGAAALASLRQQLASDAKKLNLLNQPCGKPLAYFINYAQFGDISNRMLYTSQLPSLQQAKKEFDPTCLFYQAPTLGDYCYGSS